jgi:hypothetical protein
VLYAYPPEIEESPVLPKSLEEKLKNVEGVKGTYLYHFFYLIEFRNFFLITISHPMKNDSDIFFGGGWGEKYDIPYLHKEEMQWMIKNFQI